MFISVSGVPEAMYTIKSKPEDFIVTEEIELELDEDGEYASCGYCDSIPLGWSCQGQNGRWRYLDLPYGINQFIDVIVTRSNSEFFDPQLMVKPYRYFPLFKEKGKFIFKIQLCANGIKPVNFALNFVWDGEWQSYDVGEIQ